MFITKIRQCWYWFYERIRLIYERYIHRNDYNEENPLITVYTPTYNRCKLLFKRAISSVLSQTYTNIEYIIVGDGCTDDTELLVKELHVDKVKFYNLKRKRPEHNYNSEEEWFISATYPANFALKKAKGKYIAKIDDDDIWTPDHLEKCLRLAQEENYEFISGAYEFEKGGLRFIDHGVHANSYLLTNSKNNPKLGGHSSWFYRSYLKFMKYNPYARFKKWNRVDDADLSCRMVNAGVRMGFLEDITLFVLPRPNESTIGLKAVQRRFKHGE